MNDKLIARHFQRALSGRVIVGNSPNAPNYLVSDGFLMFELPNDHRTFDSRRNFPRFPDTGETLVYSLVRLEARKNGMLTTRHLGEQRATPLILTPWLYRDSRSSASCVLLLPDNRQIYVDKQFMDLLGDVEMVNAIGYQFFGSSPSDAISVRLGDSQVAVMMPRFISRDKKSLVQLPELPA